MRRKHHRRYQGLFARLASLARSLTFPASAGRRLAGAAWLAALGALALPAAAQDQTAVLVSNTGQRSLVTSGLHDNRGRAQTFTVGADDGNYTLSSIEAEITNGRVSSADMVLLTVAIWSTHASGENAGHPDSPLYTLTKPAFIPGRESLERFGAPPNSVLGAGKTYAVVIIYNKSFDNNFNAPAWEMVNTTAEDANPAPGWSIGNTIHTSAAGSTSWRPSSHDYFKAFGIRVNGTAGGGEPVWSATMTAGDTRIGHGYDATDTPAIGTLDGDDSFDYGSLPFRVLAIDVGFVVRFVVEPGQLATDETLTLEFGGHALAFSDRLSDISIGQTLFWRVPADLEFPVGSTATVCLRTDTQVCPLGRIVASELRVADDVSAEEGENLTFTVELSPASEVFAETVTVDWATSGGTATSDTDFSAGSGTLTFAPGVTEQTFTVATIEDMTDEDHETFTVTLSNATSAAISGATATGTIENDDWPPLAWSTTLTVGNDFLAAEHYGYYASVGSLTDPYIRYRSATYIVEQVTVTTGREVFFNLDRSGLPTEDFMTLEIDGHEFPFGDRKSESTDKTWVWDAPADLHDPATNFPVGSTVLVCLRTEGQVCPTDGNVAPTFSSSATFSAAENQTMAGTVEASDSDADDSISGYAITGGADQAFFSIGATSGALTFDAAPNFEDAKDIVSVDPANAAGNNQYVVVVTATSGAVEREKTATQTITVTVTDVAGEAPGKPAAPNVSSASATSLTVSWTAPANAGPPITDYDHRHRTSPDGSWTEVADTAITALSATIAGLADGTAYDVQVRATNDEGTGDWSDSGTESTDANAAPAFDSSATFSAAENQTTAGNVLATDSDSDDDITGYEITGGADQTLFEIGATDGALTFKSAPNFEDAKDIVSVDPANAAGNNQYVVVVTATSGAVEREKTATQTITVTVTDAGGEAPGKPAAPNVSAASATSLSVSWSAPANAGPAITDYDHRHRTSPDGSWTEVTATTSTALSATIAGLADGTAYDVQVRATNDEGTGDWSDSGTDSTDANAAPSFDSSATFSAAENQTVAGTVRASDSDADDSITGYAITGGADQAFFSIGATSGALTFDAAPNFEDAKDIVSVDPANAAGNNQYVVVVTATSGAVEREKTATQTITVTVTDVAGEAPGKPAAPNVSSASATSLTVSWTAPANAGPPITDYDHRHRTSPDGSWTEVADTASTALSATIAGLADGTSYDVQVRATNDEGTGDWSDSGTESTDANAAPTFSSDDEFDAAENQTAAGTVVASDGDAGDDITDYAITGGADQGFFSISSSSGELTFDAAPNYEDAKDQDTNNTYVVEVRASSGAGEREKTATQTITVAVTDVDTEAPGKPNAPNVSAASATSLSVSWSAPANDGPAITDYDHRHRTASPEGNWTEVTGTASTALSATIAGLAEGTSYDVQVRATNDEGTGAWSDSGTESTDANAAPTFDSPSTFNAAENQTTAGTVEASDDDTDDNITGYAITGGADQAFFSIGATDGALTFKSAPNFEDAKDIVSVDPANAAGNNQYVVVVTATSGAVEREKTATQTITVTVTDVAGEAPGKPAAPNVSSASATSLTVSWTAPANAGPPITDYDHRHRTSPDGSWTEVADTASTALSATIAGLADGTSYDVQVRATNDEGTGDWSDSGTDSTDANAAPSFDSSATFSAAENQTVAGTVRASDSDADDSITGYAITGGADQAFFSIGATSGALTFDAAPNFEDAKDIVSVDPANAAGNNQYVVVVTATSGAVEREKTATQTITVTVTDVAGEAPGKPAAPNVSSASATSLTVSWTAPANAGPPITDYDHRHRTSPDGSWTEVTDTAITARSATITGLADGTAYDVQVRATNDEGTGDWSDSGTESTDANAAPAFDSSATFSAAENQTVAGTVRASDSDTDDNITGYALTGGADQAFFSIGETSGALTFDAAPNFEDAKDIVSVDPANAAGNNQYVVVVTATSGAVEREKTATQTITVTVTDAGGEAPGKPAAPNVSAASATSLSVLWSAPANAGPAITDYDHRHRTTSPEGNWTEVMGTTSTDTTATITGLADGTSYDVQVRATNDEGTGDWSDSGTGSTDANEAPSFDSSATFSAAENQTVAGTVEASDSDTGDDITGYEITGGADQAFFSIGATDGALTFDAAPNYEDAKDQGSNNTYVVEVQASSGAGERVKTAMQTITVTVTDVDTEAPGKPAAPNVSAASATSLSVSWSAPSNAGPAITDYDHRHRTSPDGSWTEVTGTTSTALSATITGLAEGTSYDVQVRATNDEGTGDWSDSGTESTDANAAPTFSSDDEFDAAENQTAAGTVEASDDDTDDNITGYAITGGADQTFFSIGATDGVLTFKSAPNFEDAKDIESVDPANAAGNNQYVVVVTATSGAGEREKTATQTITVTVTDVDTEAPGKPGAPNVSASSATSLSVSWSAPDNAGPPITDYDHRHRTSPDGSWTEVTGTTSTALSATITGLSDGTSYDVQVRATNDEGTGDWSDSGTESTDANAAPAFSSPSTFNAAENQTTAGTVEASDSDTGDDITGYEITGGADQAFFSVGATSGELTFDAAPNFEDAKDQNTNNQYVVEVQATSGTGIREKTATQTITVTVTDVDTEAPGKPNAPNVLAASATSLSVSWSAPANAGPAITDYDHRHRTSPAGSWTEVTGTTSTALSATITGLSDGTAYDVQMRATNDEGTGDWSDSGTGSTDANAAPSFDSPSTFNAAENQTTAGTVEASDDDSGDDITGYEITGGADQTFFSIGATDGALTFDAAPNYEDAKDQGRNNQYVVEVEATSGTGTREKTATQTITVTVTDVDTEAPGKPAAPNVSAASATSLSVSWTAPANAGPAITDYDVQYREGTSGGWTDGNYTGTATTATLSGLSENTSHQVQVRATNDEGTGSWSDPGSGATDANAAPAFSSDAAFDAAENQTAAGTVVASDSDSEDKIERYDITGGADQALFMVIASSGDLEFRDAPNFEDAQDQDTNNQYVVTVQATGGTGTREKTATQTVTVTVTDVAGEAPGKPDAPNVSSASVTSLTVTWAAPDNAGPAITDYDVQYRAGTSGDWSDGNHAGAATTATLTGLSENTSYQVQVQATNGDGTGAWSDSGSGATDANAAPTFDSPAAFDAAENQTEAGTVQASDSNPEDTVTGYAIVGGADQTLFSIVSSLGVLSFDAAPNFEDPEDQNTNNTYVVEVQATSGAGPRRKTATQTITVTVTDVAGEAPGKPAAPNVSAASASSLHVSWSAPANAGPAITDYDYRYRTAASTGSWTEVTDTAITAPSTTIGSLAANTSYDVQVRAVNADGESDWSEEGRGGTTDGGTSTGTGTGSGSSGSSGSGGSGSSGTGSGSGGTTGGGTTGGGSGGGSRDRPPVATDEIETQVLERGGTVTLDASQHFRDPERRTLTFTAASADPAVAAVTVDGAAVTVMGLDHGHTRVTLTATDRRRQQATQEFEVRVGRTVSFADAALSAPEGGTVELTVTVDPALEEAMTLSYVVGADADPATVDADDLDHAGRDGTVTLAAGATAAALAIAIHDDADIEAPRETFAVTLLRTAEQAERFGLGAATARVTIMEGVCDRTAQVRNTLRRSLPCAAVSAADLAALREVDVSERGLAALRGRDLSGLTGLRVLDLSENLLAALPAGVFEGLGALDELQLQDNPGAPFALTVELAREDAEVWAPGPARMHARLAQGAPLDVRVGVTATNATLSSDALDLDAGALASAPLRVTRVETGAARLTASVPALPDTRCGLLGLYRCYQGVTLAAGPPLVLFKAPPRATGEAPRAELGTDGDALRIDLDALFAASDGGALTYMARSSDPGLVSVHVAGGVLTVTSAPDGAEGTVTVTVTAADADGLSTTRTFEVTVEPMPGGLMRGWRRVLLIEAAAAEGD